MFKAIDPATSAEIVSIDPAWDGRRSELRTYCAARDLQCPECHQSVRLRAGELLRAHFAHKHKLKCSMSGESADVLDVRAALYGWLTSKFGDSVEIEKQDDARSFPRPIDCWVNRQEGPLGYVALARGMGSNRRAQMLAAIREAKLPATFVFHVSTLELADGHPGCIILSTTHRDFAAHPRFDQPHHFGGGSSVHYFDPHSGALTTFRGLEVWHPPQVYRGTRLASKLSDMLVSPKTGEFVHPGEVDKWKAWNAQRAAQVRAPATQQKAPVRPETRPRVLLFPEATCVICGQITRDYLEHNGYDKTCRCNECRRAGRR